MKAPRLKPIDLKKCCQRDGDASESDHPDINHRRQYLAKIGNTYYAGQFSRVWFGWSFDGGPWSGLQLDKPGTNASEWKALWEIRP